MRVVSQRERKTSTQSNKETLAATQVSMRINLTSPSRSLVQIYAGRLSKGRRPFGWRPVSSDPIIIGSHELLGEAVRTTIVRPMPSHTDTSAMEMKVAGDSSILYGSELSL